MSVIEITPAMRKIIDDYNTLKDPEDQRLAEGVSGAAASFVEGLIMQSNLPRAVMAPALSKMIAKVASLYAAAVYAKTKPELFRVRANIESLTEEMHVLARCIVLGSLAELVNLNDVLREVIHKRIDLEEEKAKKSKQ